MTNTVMVIPPNSRMIAIRNLTRMLHFCLFFRSSSVSCFKGVEKSSVLVVFSLSLFPGVMEGVVAGKVSDEAPITG